MALSVFAAGENDMARVATYLNFMGKTEAAFNFYRGVFGTEFSAPIRYMREVPADPPMSERDQGMVLHVSLPILAGHHLLGTDMMESMGHHLVAGNNVSINLEPDTRAETKHLFDALAEGGTVTNDLQEAFWGGLFGSVTDQYGIQWMFNCASAT
jgi:PhnB protein